MTTSLEVWHYCKIRTDNNSPCPLLQRCSLLWSFFGNRKVSGSAGVCEAQLRAVQKSCWGCPLLVLQSLPQGLLEVFTLQLIPVSNIAAYNWFLFILFCMFFSFLRYILQQKMGTHGYFYKLLFKKSLTKYLLKNLLQNQKTPGLEMQSLLTENKSLQEKKKNRNERIIDLLLIW